MASGHAMAVAHIGSQQVWLPAQEQARQKPSVTGEEPLGSHSWWKNCWPLMAAEGQKVTFL